MPSSVCLFHSGCVSLFELLQCSVSTYLRLVLLLVFGVYYPSLFYRLLFLSIPFPSHFHVSFIATLVFEWLGAS